jgi:hypothetical protein
MANADDKDEKAERLKRVREMAAQRGAVASPAALPAKAAKPVPVPVALGDEPPAQPKRSRLLDALTRLLRPGAPAQIAAPVAAADPPVFTVLVAELVGDAAGTAGLHLQQALRGRAGLEVKPLAKAFQLDTLEDPSLVSAAQLNTRYAVAGEGADLLVWGEMVKEGYRLRLATAANDDERANPFGPTTRIELPHDFAEAPAGLLYAAVLAAAEAVSESQKAAIKRLLPAAAAAAEALASKPPVQMSMAQQRTCQLVFGHAAAAAAQVVAPAEADAWFDKAIGNYRQAQRRLGRTDPGWEAGLIHKHLAAAITARAERAQEPAPLLEAAILEWRLAAETLTRANMPQEWAATQVRLGNALYRLDLLTGQTELLREALQALQATLQVYSRTETPQRWADIMHTVAQVLEVYGDQMKSAEVLQRAIETCHSILEIRTRERSPLAWAATQNTLGSALFLLDRHTEGGGHVEDAERALAAALDVFQTYGAKGPAKVAAKNLAHVRKLAESRGRRPVFDPGWADDPPGRRR